MTEGQLEQEALAWLTEVSWFPTSTLGTRLAKLTLGETGSWSFPGRIPKRELGNEERKLFLPKSYARYLPFWA